MPSSDRERTVEGERRFGFDAWKQDLYGTKTALATKRRQRGWQGEDQVSWLAETEEIPRQLLLWTGGETGVEVFGGPLPWA
jgi:hypothetical protein